MKTIKLLVFLINLLASAIAPLFSQKPILINQGQRKFVGRDMVYFIDSSQLLGIHEVKNKAFTPCPTEILNLGNLPYPVWMRFSVSSQTEQELFLEINAPLLNVVEVYESREDSTIVVFQGGSVKPYRERPVETENWLFPLPMNDSIPTTIYIKGQSIYPFQIPVAVSTKKKFVENSLLHYLFWGIYMGVMLFAFIYNFFIYLSVRERSYLYYLLYILSSVAFYIGLEGFGFKFLWSNSPGFNPMIPVFVSLTNCIITLFTLRFLRIDKDQKVLYYLGWIFIAIFILLAILNLAGVFVLALVLSQLFSLLICFYFIAAGIVSLRHGVRTAKYFLLGWSTFLIMVIVFILALNNAIPSNFFTTHGIFIGHMTEVLLLSFALADRINLLKSENEKKQKEIIIHLEENQLLQTKVNRELEQKVVERTEEVVAQKERAEKLLLNILPAKIAEELMSTGVAVPKQFNNVTVLFTDFENFTGISQYLTPKDLVDELHKNFTTMDRIIEKNGLEKIKTIGDAYLAVSGLPNETEDHAIRAVRAALEIRDYMVQDSNKFAIRIGVHSGQVVAGIVGVKKFAYDIWGDTVNTANRLESSSDPGKVNISSVTYELVKDVYRCTPRGKIEAKGKGVMDMYFVEEAI